MGIRLQDGICVWWSVIGRYAKAGMNELNDWMYRPKAVYKNIRELRFYYTYVMMSNIFAIFCAVLPAKAILIWRGKEAGESPNGKQSPPHMDM